MVRMLHGLLLPRLAPLGGAPARNNLRNPLTGVCTQLYKNTEAKCLRYAMNTHKTFRHGQILRLVSDRRIATQDELRRGLAPHKLRVTQATLSRDLQQLRLITTQEGYNRAAA